MVLKSALSCCVDIYGGREYDLVRFMGRALMERELIRTPLTQGKLSSESVQGLYGHSSNPFIILCGENTGEKTGDCMGVMLIYSGNFTASAELEPHGNARITAGIHPYGFSWRLESGGDFLYSRGGNILQQLRIYEAFRQFSQNNKGAYMPWKLQP